MPMGRRILPVAVAVASLAQCAAAGQLDDFEEKAGKKKEKSSKRESCSKSCNEYSSFGSGTYPSEPGGHSFLESFWMWVVSSPFEYRRDDPSGSMLSGGGLYEEGWSGEEGQWNLHRSGLSVMPYIRADYNWQYIDSRLDAQDVRLEAGYKALAFHGRHTHYTERNPTDHLDINQYYGVFRIAGVTFDDNLPVNGWELGIGGGIVQQIGNEEYSSGAFTLPLKIYPTDWLGIEFRPAWYRPQERVIGDYDLSADLGWRCIQVRGGYRWLWMQGEGHLFNGPYAGVSVSF